MGGKTSSLERCQSSYYFMHNVKMNRMILYQGESLVYVHYNIGVSSSGATSQNIAGILL